MNYDSNKYRALGVGETVNKGHFVTNGAAIIDASIASWGMVLDGSEPLTYLEELPALYHSTGARSNAVKGRGRFDLVPLEGMMSAARRFEDGAEIHGPRNWELGIPLSVLLSKMRRHSFQIGWNYTEDHNGAVLANAMMFAAITERIRAGILPKELDDIGYFMNETATKGKQ